MSFWKHFCTINHHKWLVLNYCFRIGLYRQGLLHDISKYSFTEFLPGVRYYTGYCSPNEGERQAKGYSSAWLHHKGRNKHHLEYWIDYSKQHNGQLHGVEMPFCYLAEMVCDRIAASKTYLKESYWDGSPLEYYERNKHHAILHPNTRQQLEYLLQLLKEKGEPALFAYLKKQLKNL